MRSTNHTAARELFLEIVSHVADTKQTREKLKCIGSCYRDIKMKKKIYNQ